MGGDHGPRVVVPAVLRVLKTHSSLQIQLVGDAPLLKETLKQQGAESHPAIQIIHTTERVEMDESPALALRHKKDSSMRRAIDLVNEGKAAACVSAGNTGALMAMARFVLKTLPGIDRPAIIAELPTRGGAGVHILDLGANVLCDADNLFQFAVMGAVLATASKGLLRPRVALLNIGSEDNKGHDTIKQTAQRLARCAMIHYIGFIEPNQVYHDMADVVVCDGFVGNMILKNSEGVAKLLLHFIKQGFAQNLLTKSIALLAKPILKSVQQKMDPDRYNGASLLGLQGVVIKSHGHANQRAYTYAIERALQEAENNIPIKIQEQVTAVLQSSESST